MAETMIKQIEPALLDVLCEASAYSRGSFEILPEDLRDWSRKLLAAMRINDPLSPILAAGMCTSQHWNRMIDAAIADL